MHDVQRATRGGVKCQKDPWGSLLHFQRLATATLSVIAISLFLLVALKRMNYPFELDRMESGMMTTVWRVVNGQQVYVRPSLQWAPFLYSPLYFYVSAMFARVTGLSYSALRLTSICATLGSCGLLIAIIRKETGDWLAGLASAGLFAMLYGLVLSWYDIGRVDSLALFFFLLAVYSMRFLPVIATAIVWVLAFQTKQSLLPIAIFSYVVYWKNPRRLLTGLGTFVALAAASIAMFDIVSHGWYTYFVFGSVPALGFSSFFAKTYVPYDLMKPLAVALCLIGFVFFSKSPSWNSDRTAFYAVFSVLIFFGIWFARAHVGSYYNTLMPIYTWICLLFGYALARATPQPGRKPSPFAPDDIKCATLTWLMAFAQISMHLYRPGSFAVSEQTARARSEFIDQVRRMPGEVWLVNHSYDGILAGKGIHAEMDAFDSVLGRHDQTSIAEVQNAVREHRFSAVFLDRSPQTYSPEWLFLGPDFKRQYPLQAFAPDVQAPQTGDEPLFMYLSCKPPEEIRAALAVNQSFVKKGLCEHSIQ